MPSSTNIAILIPAAGASRRMGSPKQLLEWGDSTLLEHAITTANALDPSELIVVLGSDFGEIKNTISQHDAILLEHQNWADGLGSSISFGIKYLQQCKTNVEGVLVTLADQPLIDADYLTSMISHFEPGKKQIIATSYGDQKMGVPVLFDAVYFSELAGLHDDQGAKVIINRHINNVLPLSSEGKTADIDTPEDYQKLYKANHQL